MILLGDSAKVLRDFNDGCIDLTVTSPPYDNIRTYGGHSFDFETIAGELYRVTKSGGVVVWVVGDSSQDGNESGSSFRQALFFKKIGFNLLDTMIYVKNGMVNPHPTVYHQIFEYMFVFSKGKPKTFNPLTDRQNRYAGITRRGNIYRRESDDELGSPRSPYIVDNYGKRFNIWYYNVGGGHQTPDSISHKHPAVMPEQLAGDHIKSWSNEGDMVLDPFSGSGTTCKMAQQLNRRWIGIEINSDYVALLKKRLTPYIEQQRLEQFV